MQAFMMSEWETFQRLLQFRVDLERQSHRSTRNLAFHWFLSGLRE